ncbi:MAG: VWA domain-containing protein [Henriciella sp.]|uniref:vWA domain-containing protein n=1 Tax=Henriciella sp. TaxID=1968823 RepID=UPI0032EC535B
MLDLSKLRGATDVPPVESRILTFDDGVAETTFDATGSMVFSFEVEDPLTSYAISASSQQQTSIVLEAMNLELNDKGQATSRETLLTTATTSLDTDTAKLRTSLFRPGMIYLGVAVMSPAKIHLKVEAVPASKIADGLPARSEDAVKVGNDIAARHNGETSCVKPAALAEGAVDLTLLRPPDLSGELAVYDGNRNLLASRKGREELKVRGVLKKDASVCVETSGRVAENTGWRLFAEPSAQAWVTAEPDDARDRVTPFRLSLAEAIRAPLDVDDIDYFEMPVAGAGKALIASVRSSVRTEVCITVDRASECYSGKSLTIGPFAASATLSVENQSVEAGVYEISIESDDFDEVSSTLEPNAYPKFHEPKPEAGIFYGTLQNGQDVDVIGFDAGVEAQMWRIVVLGEGVNQLNIYDKRGGVAEKRRTRPGKRLTTSDFYLNPGPAYIRLEGESGDYRIIAKPLGPPLKTSEREPNEALPRRLSPGQAILGTLEERDDDRFSLFLHREAGLTLDLKVPAGAAIALESNKRSSLSSPEFDRTIVEAGGWQRRVEFPAGEHVLSLSPQVDSPAEYKLVVDYANPYEAAEGKDGSPVELSVEALPVLQAFSTYRQRIEASVTIENSSSEVLTGRLEGWFAREGTDVNARLFGVRPGRVTTVPLRIDVPEDLYGEPLTGFVAAVDAQGRTLGSARVDIQTDAEAPPHGRHAALPAPRSMIGGINVALSALGASWVSVPGAEVDPETGDYADNSAGARNFPRVIDGFVEQGQGAESHAARLTRGIDEIIAPVLDLPGDAPIPVIGVGIDTRMTSNTALRKFAIDVSTDGRKWREVLRARHEVWGATRYYAFPDGVQAASLVRLRALDRRGGTDGIVEISGFDVIAEPGASGLKDINIADKGLWALMRGWQDVSASSTTLIDPFVDRALRLRRESEVSDLGLAVTFKSQMSADVAALEFVYPEAILDDYPFAREAIVSASLRGPVEPWEEIARVDLPTAPEPGEVIRHALPEYETAKAVKVDYRMPEAAYVYAPRQIRLLERPEGEDYRSVLGLWGPYTAERLNAEALDREPLASAETSHELLLDGRHQSGLVEFEERSETWRAELPDGQNILRLTVRGEPGFSPTVSATDGTGAVLAPTGIERPVHTAETRYTFMTESGGVLDLEISERQRSTVFLFDQSPSVSSYIPMIRRGIVDFADTMVEGRDAVKFKSFGGKWSQEGWYADPNNLRLALSTYKGGDRSSAEASMVDAAEVLKEQDGSRAIVVISDAETGIAPELPSALNAAQARVFVLKISSGGVTFQDPAGSQPIAAAWAGQTGGEVHPVLRAEDVSVGYARASARILGPKSYSLQAESDYRPAEPGFLSVEADDNAGSSVADSAGMLIILDASGSMLKRMEDGRRIEIAKSALAGFLADLGGDAQQVRAGLRIFGGPPGSCETELAQPVAPISVGKITEIVQAVRPQNNAKTAIGRAIERAGEDLSDITGAKSILLVTDGEETCGGDPLDAVTALREKTDEARVDVIAFALEPEIDREPFRTWAEAGGGIFVDAKTASDLKDGLNAARQTRFEVFKDGELVASGASGGEPIALVAGRYDVSVDTEETARSITILSGQTAYIDISQ